MRRVLLRVLFLVLLVLFVAVLAAPIIPAVAEDAPVEDTAPVEVAPADPGGETSPYTWGYLVTVPGSAAFALVVIQLIKAPLDKICKVPTRAVVYVICLVSMAAGTYFTIGFSASALGLIPVNAALAALMAMGAYDVTFKKIE
jgi:hypothetical protein